MSEHHIYNPVTVLSSTL